MGNQRFRLSDMMPNVWFYKLKDMSRSRNHNTSQQPIKKKHPTAATPKHFSHPRHSFYFTSEPFKADRLHNSPINPKASDTHFPDPPRKSSKRSKRKAVRSSSKLVSSSVSAGCSCRATLDSVWTNSNSTPDYSASPFESSPDPPEFGFDGSIAATHPFNGYASFSGSCSCRLSSSGTDFIIDVDTKKSSARKFEKLDVFDSISELELPPILTKPAKFSDMISDIKKKETQPAKFRRSSAKLEERNAHGSLSVKIVKEESVRTLKEQKTSHPLRRSSPGSPGLKLRANSPRIASKKIQAHSRKIVSSTASSRSSRRKSLSDSFAVMKSSFDPQKDFRDSMVEMIVENNIRASKDLEELLACYLSLNSNEYHDLIVKVFEQIWFNLTDIRS